MHCKCSQHNQKKRTANTHNTTIQINVLQIKLFICLCCEHLQHLLSNWWRCFLDLPVLFLFACVFWSFLNVFFCMWFLSKKLRKLHFYQIHLDIQYVRWSKQRWSRWLPSAPQSLHSPLPLPGSIISLGNIRQFSSICRLLLMIALFFISSQIAHFCVFLACVFDRDILDSFRGCVIAPPSV